MRLQRDAVRHGAPEACRWGIRTVKYSVAIIITILIAVCASGVETEPNWTNRYLAIRQSYLDSFKAPIIGSKITVQKRIGGDVTGTIEVLSSNAVVVSGVKYDASLLTDETCSQLFAGFYANRSARADVIKERNKYLETLRSTTIPEVADNQRITKPESKPATKPLNQHSEEEPFYFYLKIVVGVIVFFVILRKIRKYLWRKKLLSQANRYFAEVNSQKGLIPITSTILLKKGEQAYLETNTTLMETRSVRYSSGGGAGVRVAKGVYVGAGGSKSESNQEWRRIDTGVLVVTNQRIIFDGSSQNRVSQLDSILSVTPYFDAIEISLDGRQKSIMFDVANPYIWAAVINILCSTDDPQHIDGLNVQIKFD